MTTQPRYGVYGTRRCIFRAVTCDDFYGIRRYFLSPFSVLIFAAHKYFLDLFPTTISTGRGRTCSGRCPVARLGIRAWQRSVARPTLGLKRAAGNFLERHG